MAEIEGYDMPDELYYHKEHAWARVEDDGKVTVGMDGLFAKTAGDIVYVDMPMEGDDVEQDETIGKVQSSKWIGKLISPVAGEVAELNEAVETDSTLINSDPYGEGWILKIEPSAKDDDLAKLFHGETVVEWIKAEAQRAKEGAEGAKE
ncbi:MAG: glycine cleavage system protein H [Planctomycetota bacterium]|jgi:glycine cleavage system H protein